MATATKLPPGKAPVKGDRAIQTWALATSESQGEAVVKELQGFLLDPDKEIRLAAAWTLGHTRVKETGQEALAYDEKPSLKKQTRPVYPPDAYYGKIQGTVRVEFLIDEVGRVAHAEVRDSIAPLDAAAVECVKQWRFTPARFAGKAVPAMAGAPVTFRITK